MQVRVLLLSFAVTPWVLSAQVQPCLVGGNGDGAATGCGSNAPAAAYARGGAGDGAAIECGANTASGIAYWGGAADGHATGCGSSAANNTIYAGGHGDGVDEYGGRSQANNAVFTGGSGDGTDAYCASTTNTNLTYRGGPDDGWASGAATQVFNALRINVLLEGPYEPFAGLMRDDLRFQGVLPLSEPYSALGSPPIGYTPGSTTNAVLDVSGPDAIVDWVQLELRAPSDNTQPVARVDALIQRDGDVVAMDGRGPVVFARAAGNYFVVIKHRNHLAAMSAVPVALSCTPNLLDFTGTAPLFGTQPTKDINGVQVLWAGNTNPDNQIKYTGTANDRDPILLRIGGIIPTNTVMGYFIEDVNMDGIVKYTGSENDRDIILVNIGGVVPTNIRLGQVP
jgi:hypothetical protein